jgi:hypothetical protein
MNASETATLSSPNATIRQHKQEGGAATPRSHSRPKSYGRPYTEMNRQPFINLFFRS